MKENKSMNKTKFISGYFYTQLQTTIHKFWVFYYMAKLCIKDKKTKNKCSLLLKSFLHDLSKYSWAEAKGFACTIFDLKKSQYGTEEYKELLKTIDPSIKHHYKINKHHPQYWENGFKDMPEMDKIEMVVDWRAATRRHSNGDIYKSLDINQQRFNYSDQDKEYLKRIVDIIY